MENIVDVLKKIKILINLIGELMKITSNFLQILMS